MALQADQAVLASQLQAAQERNTQLLAAQHAAEQQLAEEAARAALKDATGHNASAAAVKGSPAATAAEAAADAEMQLEQAHPTLQHKQQPKSASRAAELQHPMTTAGEGAEADGSQEDAGQQDEFNYGQDDEGLPVTQAEAWAMAGNQVQEWCETDRDLGRLVHIGWWPLGAHCFCVFSLHHYLASMRAFLPSTYRMGRCRWRCSRHTGLQHRQQCSRAHPLTASKAQHRCQVTARQAGAAAASATEAIPCNSSDCC